MRSDIPGWLWSSLALTVVILFLLVMITVRTAHLLEEKSALRLLRRWREAKAGAKPETEAPPGTPDYVPERPMVSTPPRS